MQDSETQLYFATNCLLIHLDIALDLHRKLPDLHREKYSGLDRYDRFDVLLLPKLVTRTRSINILTDTDIR